MAAECRVQSAKSRREKACHSEGTTCPERSRREARFDCAHRGPVRLRSPRAGSTALTAGGGPKGNAGMEGREDSLSPQSTVLNPLLFRRHEVGSRTWRTEFSSQQ